MSPWWIRNYLVLDKVVILAEQSGNPLLWGTFPFDNSPTIDVSEDPKLMQEKAIERIKMGFTHEPLLYASWYTWGKSWYLIKDIWPGNHNVSKLLFSKLAHYLIVFLGFSGLLIMLF